MSGDQTPLLAGVIPVFEIFMTGWEKLKGKRPHLAPFIQPGLDSTKKYYSRMDQSRAYVVGMCTSINQNQVFSLTDNFSVVNPSIRMSWIMNNWEEAWQKKAVDMIRELVSIVFDFVKYFIANTRLRWRNTGNVTCPPPPQSQSNGMSHIWASSRC
jgi:hypothetical protein